MAAKMLTVNMLYVIVTVLVLNVVLVQNGSLPTMNDDDHTTCEEFSRFARFNPYTLLDDEWMLFYYWGPPQDPMIVKFIVPTPKHKSYMRYEMGHHLLETINWKARSVFMKEKNNCTYYLEEVSDRGHYKLYELYKNIKEGVFIRPVDVRFKQTGDNRYFAAMICSENIVFLFSRVNDLPKKKDIKQTIAKFGYRGRGGKSYLYQGHQWMPIDEAEDEDYENAVKRFNSYNKK